ncbi:hypothetical protein I552_0967 [Mycobacterium xenopi 3993]|nr:hypothetical protein I552_0967 [Mycobacterium xenopi 3993]
MGVRAPATITDVVMITSSAGVDGRFGRSEKHNRSLQVTVAS